MVHVLVTGTFDGLHRGHRFLFKKARQLGDRLTVVVARDATVTKVKGRRPDHSQTLRRQHVARNSYVHRAVLGQAGPDKLAIIARIKPHIVALGYDQRAFTQNLQRLLRARGLSTQVVRLPAYKPHLYKSKLIRVRKQRQALRKAKRHGSLSKP